MRRFLLYENEKSVRDLNSPQKGKYKLICSHKILPAFLLGNSKDISL